MDFNQFYKEQSPQILSVLVRLFGAHNLELAEDVMQESFQKAYEKWNDSPPENPKAWIVQVAKNRAIDIIRAKKNQMKFADDLTYHLESEWSLGQAVEEEFSESNIKDDLLQMIFMCCRPHIKPENRLPFILKTLCGFSLEAVARALVLPPETVKKRLARVRADLKQEKLAWPPEGEMLLAMDSIHTVIYLIFNEGFYSSDKKAATNVQLCQEAMGLIGMLTAEPRVVNQDTFSLYALMLFHMGRFESKTDGQGYNIPIDLQDRSLWQTEYFRRAAYWLGFATRTPQGASGRFFIEAQIAKEHCSAQSFQETNWKAIEMLYQQLFELTQSPVAKLNFAIAMGYGGKIDQAIEEVNQLSTEKPLAKSHMPFSVLAHFYAKKGDRDKAYQYAEKSKSLGGTSFEQKVMMEQLERMLPPEKG